MSMVAIRVSDKEKKLMEQFAKFEGKTLSAYLIELFYEKLEDFEDMQAIKNYERVKESGKMITYSHEEVGKMLGID